MKVLVVDWLDALSWGGSWAKKDKQEMSHCRSYGFLLEETKEAITLVQTIGFGGEHLNGVTIPKGCIVKRREIKDDRYVGKT